MGTVGAILLLLATNAGQEPEVWHGSLGELAQKHLHVEVDPLLADLPIFVPKSRLYDPGLLGAIQELTYSEIRGGGSYGKLTPTEYGRRYWTFAERYLEMGHKAALGAWEYSRDNVDWTKPRPTQFLPSKMPELDWDWADLVQAPASVSTTDPRYDVRSYDPWIAVFAQNLPPETANAFARGERIYLVVPDDTKGKLTAADLEPLLRMKPDSRTSVSIWLQLDPTSGKTESRSETWTSDGERRAAGRHSSIHHLDRNYANKAFPRVDVENLVSKFGERRARRMEELVETAAEQYSGRVVGLALDGQTLRSVPETVYEKDGWIIAHTSHAWQVPALIDIHTAISELTDNVAAETGALLDLARAWERVPVWYQSLDFAPTTAYANLNRAWDRQPVLYLIDQMYEWDRDRAWSDWVDVKEGTPLARAVRFLRQRGGDIKRELPARIRLKRKNLFDPNSPGKPRNYLHLNTGRDPLENWPDPYDRWKLDVSTHIEVMGDYVDGVKRIGDMMVYQTIGYGDAQTLIKMAQEFEDSSKLGR